MGQPIPRFWRSITRSCYAGMALLHTVRGASGSGSIRRSHQTQYYRLRREAEKWTFVVEPRNGLSKVLPHVSNPPKNWYAARMPSGWSSSSSSYHTKEVFSILVVEPRNGLAILPVSAMPPIAYIAQWTTWSLSSRPSNGDIMSHSPTDRLPAPNLKESTFQTALQTLSNSVLSSSSLGSIGLRGIISTDVQVWCRFCFDSYCREPEVEGRRGGIMACRVKNIFFLCVTDGYARVVS